MTRQKQKKPSSSVSDEPRRTKPKTAGENRGSTRPKQDHKGQGRRAAEASSRS